MKYLFITICFIPLFVSLSGQSTGAFKQTITFEASDYNYTRDLYLYVPEDYDASQQYKLVVGFRGGPHSNAGQFRDQLTFLSDSLGAIILCPENKDHFWNDEGLTKQLFKYAVDTTMQQYSIDSNFIYLTGLSYGGRHAVIVSMDTDNGPIPKIRGVIPFAAGSESHLAPNYENIEDFPPACICIGLSDNANFINVSNSLYADIQTYGGDAMLNEINGVGHTVVFPDYPSEMMECINYIEGVYAITSAQELENDYSNITIYPNPTNGFIQIKGLNGMNIKALSIIDVQGHLLYESGNASSLLDVSLLPSGVYILLISREKKTMSKIFIKE